MKQTKKGNNWYFGMKAHMGVDADTGPVHTVAGTHADMCGLNLAKASVVAKVEQPFRVIKRQLGFPKVRYRGLAKNTAPSVTLFALSNLWMARRKLFVAL